MTPVETVKDALVSVGEGVVAFITPWHTQLRMKESVGEEYKINISSKKNTEENEGKEWDLFEARMHEDPDVHRSGLPGSHIPPGRYYFI